MIHDRGVIQTRPDQNEDHNRCENAKRDLTDQNKNGSPIAAKYTHPTQQAQMRMTIMTLASARYEVYFAAGLKSSPSLIIKIR